METASERCTHERARRRDAEVGAVQVRVAEVLDVACERPATAVPCEPEVRLARRALRQRATVIERDRRAIGGREPGGGARELEPAVAELHLGLLAEEPRRGHVHRTGAARVAALVE